MTERALTSLSGRPAVTPRVLLVCDWFLKYVAPFAIALRSTGAQVAVLCRTHAFEFGGAAHERQELVDAMRAAHVAVIELPGRSSSLSREARRALRDAYRFTPHVIQAQSEIHDPRFFVPLRGRPLILTIHDPERHLGAPSRPLRLRILEKLWERRADAFVVHSSRFARSRLGRRPTYVLPHGVTTVDVPLAVPTRPAVVLFGRLEYYKGVRVLVKAMKEVWATRPETELIIAGRGPEAAIVPRDKRITLLDEYLPEAEIDDLLARASLVVLPYLDASQSGVGLLAAARGIPLVATDVGALPEIVLDDSFVAPPGDAAALAERLLRHLDHDAALRRQVIDRTRTRYDWKIIAARARGVYTHVAPSAAGFLEPWDA